MTSSVGGTSMAQYLRTFEDSIDQSTQFQEIGQSLAKEMGSLEEDLIAEYAKLETAGDDKSLAVQQGRIQALNIKYKRLESLMELFQNIVKSHYEMLQRAINNIPVRG